MECYKNLIGKKVIVNTDDIFISKKGDVKTGSAYGILISIDYDKNIKDYVMKVKASMHYYYIPYRRIVNIKEDL